MHYEFIILAAVIGIIIGLLIGATLQKRMGASEALNRKLRETLDQEVENRKKYQQSVTAHFSETSKLLNELTFKYKDIHEHLAAGAQTLCTDADGQSLLTGTAMRISIEQSGKKDDELDENSTIQPPLDYAPKKAPNDKTLAEEYGLEKVNLHQSASMGTENIHFSDPLFAGQSASIDDLDLNERRS